MTRGIYGGTHKGTLGAVTRSFFNPETLIGNDDAGTLGIEAAQALKPIFDKYEAMGYSVREISYVIQNSTTLSESSRVLRRQAVKRG